MHYIGIFRIVITKKPNLETLQENINQTQIETDLGIYKDSIYKYTYLTLTFNADYTFFLNFPVPFMNKMNGKWKVGGMGEWCEIEYSNTIKDQFAVPYEDNGDSIL